jgi:hypothetical protein
MKQLCILLGTVLCLVFIVTKYNDAFPVIHSKTSMNREEVISETERLIKEFNISCPTNFYTIPNYRIDSNFIHYVDYKFGYSKLSQLTDVHYFPFQWLSRSFKENEICEIFFIFTSKGNLYGFEQVKKLFKLKFFKGFTRRLFF